MRFTSCGACLTCNQIKSKKWYSNRGRSRLKMRNWRADNKDRDNENRRKWMSANKDRMQATTTAWNKKNRLRRLAINRSWYKRNAEKERQRARRKRHQNLEKYRGNSRQYNSDNLPRLAVIARNRRARQKQNGGKHTIGDVAIIFKHQNGCCGYCRAPLTLGNCHVDHIVPLARGGANGRQNLQVLCPNCNQTKSARDPIEFARSRGLLI